MLLQSDAPEEGDVWTAWQLFPPDDDQRLLFRKKERKSHVPLASYSKRLCGRRDVLIFPSMGSMIIKPVTPKRAEVACSVGQLCEDIAWAKRRVHISAREFDGNIRSTILNGWQWNSAAHSSLSPRYPLCTFSVIVYLTPKYPGLRRTIRIPLLIVSTSLKRRSRK